METSNFIRTSGIQTPTETRRARRAAMTEAERATERERNRALHRERRSAMTDEERALHLQRRRDQYRRRRQASASSQHAQNTPDQDNANSLTDGDVAFVVDALRAHANLEVSRMFGHPNDVALSVNTGTLALDFGNAHVSHQFHAEIPQEDYIDTYEPHRDEDDHFQINEPDQRTRPPVTNRRQGRRSPLQRSYENCARNYVDSPEYERFILPPPTTCRHCQAKLFPYESTNLCRKGGKVVLPYQPPPQELLHLYTASTPQALHFQKNARSFNHVFSFTSMGVHLDASLANNCAGVYTYRTQGTIYHKIGSLLPQTGRRPRFLQMYVYDTDHELENRLAENEALDPQVLAILKRILDNYNVFVHVLRRIAIMDNVTDIRLHLKERRPDQHQYSLPTASQVAAILIGGDDPYDFCERDIIVQTQGGQLLNVPDTAGFYDHLQYPLLHPYGEFGWDVHLHNQYAGSTMSCRAYYCYIFQDRANCPSLVLSARRLLQQFAVDAYVKISTQQLRYIRDNQVKLRAELYQGLYDSVANGETRACNIGRRIILPASFIGSPRYMHERYYDAMAIVQKFGKPDLFITMTCNPNWEEIQRELKPGQTSQDRPDITTQIFHSKCEELKKDLFTKGVLGKVVAHVYVIGFQKRGLPHAHLLLILDEAHKLRQPADFDAVVRAEIPDKNTEPDLFRIVMSHMIHGPCGYLNNHQPCMKPEGCKKKFPKDFADYTLLGIDSYPIYRRRRNGPRVRLNGIVVDNRWVVPYKPWLLRKYDCHLNVEVCSTIKCVKYLYKYVYKGSDRCSMEISDKNDEIKQFTDGRWISSQEAFWRIFQFPLNRIYPSVYSLQVHLPDMQEIQFPDDQPLAELLRDESIRKTMLTEFFYTNSVDPTATQYLYRDFPEHYTWSKKYKCWYPRVGHGKVIGRIHTATPADPERYYLRLLLNHVKGPTSFEHLKTVITDGVTTTYSTFKEAADKLGLLEKDHAVRECLLEASAIRLPDALIQLFGTLLIFCSPVDPRQLWNEFHEYMIQQFPSTSSSVHAVNSVLAELESFLAEHNKKLSDFNLPQLPPDYTDPSRLQKEIVEELSVEIPTRDLGSYKELNDDQKRAFHTILEAANLNNEESQRLFFIDGPGGSGKTFLYRSLLAHFRKNDLIALATATSGLAAIMMPGGRTAHSRFKIPVPITATSTCKVGKHTGLAHLLRLATIIIWDEATVAHRHTFEALDRSLRDITGVDAIFGGKLVVLGGDYRQVLPIVPHGSRTDIVNACVRNSYIWDSVQVIPLRQNMRALEDPSFSEFLLRIGDGTEFSIGDDTIKMPNDIIVPWENEDSLRHLISIVFPDISQNAEDPDYVINRALLTTTNDQVDVINDSVLELFPGETHSYFSYDSVDNDPRGLYQIEFLNSVTQGDLPQHRIDLKVGCPIILTRIINPSSGLCNGTRLLCRNFYPNIIDAEIVTGAYKGKTVFLHRIPLKASADLKLPFSLTRKQFPIRLSFALTIHKSQGQTIPFVGIYLPHHVFAHGQLYVALSRGRSRRNTNIMVRGGQITDCLGVFTKNIVYSEVL